MKKEGKKPVTRVLENKEFKVELFRKFGEEFREYRQADCAKDRVEEMGDIFTVLKSICELDGINIDDVVQNAAKKNIEKGEFKDKIYLDI